MKKKPQDKDPQEPEVYTLKEITAYLRLTDEQIINLAKQNKIPALEVGGGWLFPRKKVQEWIESGFLESLDEKNVPEALLKAPLKNFIPNGGVLFLPHKKPKDSVLEYLVSKSHQLGCISDPEDFLSCLKAREDMVSTATEKGVAFLHTRQRIPKHLLMPFILIAISKQGLDWGAPDNKPTHVLFLIAMRHDIMHLKILSQLARMTNSGLVEKILQQKDQEGVLKVISSLEKKVPRN